MSTPKPLAWLPELAPYVGGESEIEGQDRIIKLASNEGAFGPSPQTVAAIKEAAEGVFRYPDGDYTRLREALSERHGLELDRIVIGSGSDELIMNLCRCYVAPDDEVLFTRHAFAMYPIYARGVGASLVSVPEHALTADVDGLLNAVTDRTRILFLANPNNPTGTYISDDEVTRLRNGLPEDVMLVLDCAYAEYVKRDDYSDYFAFTRELDNTVVLRTFSKIHGLGGIRLGWGYFPTEIADILHRIRSPFNVSVIAEAAGLAALADTEFVEMSQAHNEEWRRWTADALRKIGLVVPDSVCNFVLVRFPEAGGKTAEAADAFLKSRGIIVRRMGGYGLPDSIRLSIGLEEEMRIVVDTLTEYMATND